MAGLMRVGVVITTISWEAVTTDSEVTKGRRQVVHQLANHQATHKSRQSKHGLDRRIGLVGTLRVPEFLTVTSLTLDIRL
jgi:hypothetical protein